MLSFATVVKASGIGSFLSCSAALASPLLKKIKNTAAPVAATNKMIIRMMSHFLFFFFLGVGVSAGRACATGTSTVGVASCVGAGSDSGACSGVGSGSGVDSTTGSGSDSGVVIDSNSDSAAACSKIFASCGTSGSLPRSAAACSKMLASCGSLALLTDSPKIFFSGASPFESSIYNSLYCLYFTISIKKLPPFPDGSLFVVNTSFKQFEISFGCCGEMFKFLAGNLIIATIANLLKDAIFAHFIANR